jgi:hypothetical protein
MKTSIKTIDIQAKEWFDKVNGNSYFAGVITINYGMSSEQVFKIPFQYGSGDQYITEAQSILSDNKVTSEPLRGLKEQGVIVRQSIQRNCLKKDVKNFGL